MRNQFASLVDRMADVVIPWLASELRSHVRRMMRGEKVKNYVKFHCIYLMLSLVCKAAILPLLLIILNIDSWIHIKYNTHGRLPFAGRQT